MRKGRVWRATAVAAVLAVSVTARVQASDAARGQELYALCGTCHGNDGEGQETYSAPRIAGLPAWYVEAQISKFQSGLRGYDANDATGLQMRPMARALAEPADVKAVATYVSGLAAAPAPATVAGDSGRGKGFYAPCVTCHGADGKGNEALHSPPLLGQADWYLVAQLGKFRAGTRGTHPQDTTGLQMRPMAMILPDEQAVQDVAAYVRSLGE